MASRTPSDLKSHFKPKLAEWGIDSGKLALLDDVTANWLRGADGEDIAHFRQRRRRQLRALDDMLSYGIVTQTTDATRYQPKFMAFCLLLASGNRIAVKLRMVMDDVNRSVRRFLEERPLSLQRPISEVQAAISESLQPLLTPALHLMADSSMGVYVNNAQTQAPQLAYSDVVYRFDTPTDVAWNFLEGYRGLNGQVFAGIELASMPFNLAGLQLANEVHASALKAIANLNSHPDSAVSHARAALEATFKHVLGAGHPELSKPFPKQADACRGKLRLDSEFAALGTRIVATAIAVSDVRNAFGDSHGRSAHDRGATRSEARLVVGTALQLCEFLLERWEAVRSLPSAEK